MLRLSACFKFFFWFVGEISCLVAANLAKLHELKPARAARFLTVAIFLSTSVARAQTPAYVQQCNDYLYGTSATCTVTGVGSGHTLVIGAIAGNTSVSSVTSSTGTPVNVVSPGDGMVAYILPNTASGDITITVNTSGDDVIWLSVTDYSGTATSPLDGYAAGSCGGYCTASSASFTTTVASDRLWSFCRAPGGSPITPGTAPISWTARPTPSGSGFDTLVEDGVAGAAGSYYGQCTNGSDILTIALAGTSPAAATPTFSPGSGNYSSPQTVTISASTPSSTIYYTTDGTTPTTASTVYSGPITVAATTETIKAIATASGYTASAVGTAAYTIGGSSAPSYVRQCNDYLYGSSATCTVTGVGAGHTLVIGAMAGFTSIASVTSSTGTPVNVVSPGNGMVAYILPNTASGDITITANTSGDDVIWLSVTEYSGTATSSLDGFAAGTCGGYCTASSASFTTTVASDRLWSFCKAFGGVTITPGTAPISWTARPTPGSGGNPLVEDGVAGAAGSYYGQCTDGSDILTIALKPPTASSVSITPSNVSLYGGQTQQFQANTVVSWSLVGAGAINSTGFYTAPAVVTSQQTVTISATSQADSTTASVTLTLLPPVTPSISGLSPSSGVVGTSVTISGSHFGSSQGTSTVSFNGISATPTSWNDMSITVPAPSGATTGNVVVTVGGNASNGSLFTVGLQSNGPISYSYDKLGRLTRVVDGYGNAATYTYDAVGNILSISRSTVGQVRINDFFPAAGPSGTAVTINGVGFSSTGSQNSVAFNGVSAAITSSSATQIIATVPTGATSGPISVASPGGSSASNSPFNVTSIPNGPVITSFTPIIAASGTLVSISGTGFDANLPNNRVQFNLTSQPAATASPTNLTAVVPTATGSGHISVATPDGQAVSSQDLFVPLNNHAASDVGFTSRISDGASTTMALNTGQIGQTIFDANAGDIVHVLTANNSFVSCSMYLFDPRGNSKGAYPCDPSGVLSDPLPSSGTYTLQVEPQSAGSMSLALNVSTRAAALSLPIDGPPVTVTTTVPGKVSLLTFSGSSGQHLVLSAGNVTYSQCSPLLYDPFGSPLLGGSTCTYFDLGTLPRSGTYELRLDTGSSVGSALLQLNSVNDATGVLTIDGSPFTVTTNPPQSARLSFYSSGGQHILVQLSGESYSACTITLYDPNGFAVHGGTGSCSGSSDFISSELFTSGTYSLVISPGGSAGGTTVQVTSIQDLATSLTVDGPPTLVTTTNNWQYAKVHFIGATGQSVTLQVTGATFNQCELSIFKPDGVLLVTPEGAATFPNGCATHPQLIYIPSLPASGTYTILLAPLGSATGSATLRLSSVASSQTSSIIIDGPPVPVSTSSPGQLAYLTFSGTAGQTIVLNQIDGNFYPCVGLAGPPGTGLLFKYDNCPNLSPVTLPTTGTYTFTIGDPSSATDIGSATFQLSSISTITGTIVIDGSPFNLTITSAWQRAQLTFSGSAGQSVMFVSSNLSSGLSCCSLTVMQSNGNEVWSGWSTPNSEPFTLPSTGSYTVTVQPSHSVGSMALSLSSAPADVDGGAITIDGPPVSITTQTPGQKTVLSFSATAGQVIDIEPSGLPSASALSLIGPDGSAISYQPQNWAYGGFYTGAITLNQSGVYHLKALGTIGTLTSVQITSVPADLPSATTTIDGTPVTLNFTANGQSSSINFQGTAGQVVNIGLQGGSCSVTLFDPAMKVMGNSNCSPYSSFPYLKLLTTGTYTLKIQAWQPNNIVTTVASVPTPPADSTGAISVGGAPFTVPTLASGQREVVTFTGTSGTTLLLTANYSGYVYNCVSVFDPNGQSVSTMYCGAGQSSAIKIQKTGPYSIVLYTSGVTLQLLPILPPPANTGTIAIGGAPAPLSTTQQNGWLTFNGIAGQKVSMAVSGSSYVTCSAAIFGPSGSQVSGSNADCGGNSYMSPIVLQATGAYTIFANTSRTSGTVTFQLYNIPSDATASTSIGGSPVTVTTTAPGQAANLTFNATAGQSVNIQLSGNTMSAVSVTLFGIDGSTLNSVSGTGNSLIIPSTSLPFTGVYEIQIVPSQSSSGSITVAVSTP